MSDQTPPYPQQPSGAPQPEPSPKNWFVRHKFLTALGVIVVLAIFGSMTGGGSSSGTDATGASSTRPATNAATDDTTPVADETPSPANTPKPKPTHKPKPESAPAAMRVQAKTMLQEFEDNEAAADAKYKGKTLRVTGVVDKVDTELWDDSQYIIELNGGGDWDILSVNCNDVAESVAAKVKTGSTASVVGQFDDGGDLGVELKDCTLVR